MKSCNKVYTKFNYLIILPLKQKIPAGMDVDSRLRSELISEAADLKKLSAKTEEDKEDGSMYFPPCTTTNFDATLFKLYCPM